jgi:predicted 3-demethylubiquinone-9 3-methyltransferase (glyoxalase superfamily)
MSKLEEIETNVEKISPFLWFDDNAEEAAKFYTSIFKNSRIMDTTHYGESAAEVSGRSKGTVMTMTFELEGEQFMALNGGPIFKFSPAISFLVSCETQQEIDIFWEKLSEGGGEQEQCGWLKDKFGVSWQIVPSILAEMIHDKDANKSERVIKAMLQMKKLNIGGLRKAYEEVDRRP